MAGIRKLAEVVLWVGDMERSLAFYRDLLGLEVFSPPQLPGKFLRVGEAEEGVPQQVVLVPRPADAPAGDGGRVPRGLHHIGLEVAPADYEPLRERIERAGYTVRAGTHPFMPVEAFYIDDPDGNEVEIVRRTG